MKLPILITSVFLGSTVFYSNSHTANIAVTSPAEGKKITSSVKRSTNIVPSGRIHLIIDKSDYELNVYDEKGWFATYPVVFGNNTLEDKKMEGDRCTPEGEFRIQSKRIHEKWNRFMGIDYPTKESYDRFKRRKANGEIPSSAKIGGAIGIHGTWPNDDYIIDRYKNWTMGCISMKNTDVQDLYSYMPIGTIVTIRK